MSATLNCFIRVSNCVSVILVFTNAICSSIIEILNCSSQIIILTVAMPTGVTLQIELAELENGGFILKLNYQHFHATDDTFQLSPGWY